MFCPTSLDQYFSEHFNALDSNHNKKQNFKQRLSLETRRRESEDTTER